MIFLLSTSNWCKGEFDKILDAVRGQSVGTNSLLISFVSFEKIPKIVGLKTTPMGSKNINFCLVEKK